MKEVDELIRKVAEKKAEAARETADVIAINDIVFDAGVLPGEVRMERGIEKLHALLGGELHEGYVKSGKGYAYYVRYFWFAEVSFFEETFLLLRLPPDERGELIESADELSVRELKAKIDELKKQNEQLTFELEENSSADELEDARAEIEKLKAALAEEKKTKVLPAPELSPEEKKKLQKKLKEEAEKEVAKERQRAEKADAQAKAEAAKAEDERRKREIAERESKALAQRLEEARAENEKLQSNAKKPLPTQTKERVKALISVALDSFTQAANAVKSADEAERGNLKAGLVKLAEELGKMAESL